MISGQQNNPLERGESGETPKPQAIDGPTRCLVCDGQLITPARGTDDDGVLGTPPGWAHFCRRCRLWYLGDAIIFRPPRQKEARFVATCRALGILLLIAGPTVLGILVASMSGILKDVIHINPQLIIWIPISGLLCGLGGCLLIAVREPFVAIVDSEGIEWRRATDECRGISWLTISSIEYDADAHQLIIHDNKAGRLRAVEKIILADRDAVMMRSIVELLRKRRASCWDEEAQEEADALDAEGGSSEP